MRALGLIVLWIVTANTQDQCRTPNGDAGTCILLEKCEPLNTINRKRKKSQDDILFLQQSNCGLFLKVKPKVCCPPKYQWDSFTTVKPSTHPYGPGADFTTKPTTTTYRTTVASRLPIPDFTTSDECKPSITAPKPESFCCGLEASSAERISGGKFAKIDQFPWLTLLEYHGPQGIKTPCGGSLISARYVVTAAHCIVQTIWGAPTRVRLAEYNTSSYPIDEVHSEGDGLKRVEVIIIGIESQIRHPYYSNKPPVNDIGLVKLTRNAPYTEFIRPICLPTKDLVFTEETTFFAAGWGSDGTEFSEVKRFVELPFVPLEQCKKVYAGRRNNNSLTETHLCAGGEKKKDTCRGDSGGPLMEEFAEQFVLVGITSFGALSCGQKGVPGVYTNVYKFTDWISSNMV